MLHKPKPLTSTMATEDKHQRFHLAGCCFSIRKLSSTGIYYITVMLSSVHMIKLFRVDNALMTELYGLEKYTCSLDRS